MAPESSTGKPKNFLAKLGLRRPGTSRSPSSTTAPNVSSPPTTHQEPQRHGLTESGKTVWKSMEVALRLLEKSAEAFPPLKSAVGGLVACLDLAKNVTANQEEYVKLAEEFKEMASTLAPYASQLAAAGDGGSIGLIIESIDEELVGINVQLERGKGKKIIEAVDDQGDILTRYRKIDSLFRRLSRDVTLRNYIEIGKLREATEATLLRTLTPVGDARFNSGYSTTVQRRGCTASTREQILDDLKAWAIDPAGSKVFWMNGMAGTGKTTIVYSFCQWLKDAKRLAGNFFCNRTSVACGDLNNIWRSIAYQLAHYSPAFHSQLCKILETEHNPQELNVEAQFEWIMQKPLQNSKDAIPDGAVIVIDALDECSDVIATARFLTSLLQNAAYLPIKFMVASRPEPVILKNMQTRNFSPSVLRLHNIEQSLVEADIKRYLQEELSTMVPVPSSKIIDELAGRSGKLFIYAATVARYINPEDEEVNSKNRLDTILGLSSSSSNLQQQELDKLYTSILSSTFDKTRLEEGELKITSLVLRTVICAIEPMTTSTMSKILGIPHEDVTGTLSRLQSVLHVQEGPSGLVSILHASFPDFLCNEARSRDFYCNIVEHNAKLAHSCFDVMCKELHFNICDLESSYDFDEVVPDLDQKIKVNISAALLYACRYWNSHLVHCDLTSSIHYRLVEFLKFRFLFWLEVLNLTKSISMCSKMLLNALAWFIRKAPDHVFKETEKELYDADLFVKTFSFGACKKSTPHIYISALPFCYKSNSVYQNYWSQTTGLIVVNGTSLTHQGNRAIGVWRTSSVRVHFDNPVVFAPDGSTFASRSLRGGVDIRDVQSGEIVFSLTLEDNFSIKAMVFSPDNSKIVTGSGCSDVRVWEVQTGNLIAEPLITDGDIVSSFTFSRDSKNLALLSREGLSVLDSSSCEVLFGPFKMPITKLPLSLAFTPDGSNILISSPSSLVVVNARTGYALDSPLKAIKGVVASTAISPDGTMVAFGYKEGMIYIWDTHARTIIHGPFVGHRGWVSALVFSHDGKKLVSGSSDATIQIWDIDTGDTIAGPFEGHSGRISSLALSSDGTKIISDSWDGTLRLWNAFTEGSNTAPPRQSVTDVVVAVAWSPDSTRIASGQSDGTIVVWNAQNGEAVLEPFCHSSRIFSIAFSPDGSRISAGAKDGTVVSWDSRTGEIVGKPFQGHSDSVRAIVYSPNGTKMASASFDRTVIIWDCATGKMIGKPLRHNDVVHSVTFTPDSERLVSGGEDRLIYVWSIRTGRIILGPVKGHKWAVLSVACSPDQSQFVSGSSDETICVWSMATGRMTAGPFDIRSGDVTSVAYSRDGTRIVFGSSHGVICVLDAKTGKFLAYIDGHAGHVTSVAVSPDGSKLISGSREGSVRIWQLDILTSSDLLRNAPTIWMPNDVIIPNISDMARYENDGWVVLNDMHLFWTPPEFWVNLCYPYNPIVIGPRGTTRIDYSLSKLFIGKMWSNCWIYGPTVKASITQ
ncbi:WD40 repeat-like protein [Agrocybe pediades]|nr:WD40 repeat-like protein [Agrocybe pediades]